MDKKTMFTLPENGIAKLSLRMSSEAVVYTSYVGNAKKFQAMGVVAVAICQYPPRFVKGCKSYKTLAPSAAMLSGLKSGTMTNERFGELYEEILAKHDPHQVYQDLLNLGEGKPVAILCYEKPPDTCHRHAVTRWLEEAGILIKEYPF